MAKGKPVAVYADAGLLTVNPSDIGGAWAYVFVDKSDRVVSEEAAYVLKKTLKVTTVSNVVMEQIAILKAMEALPAGWNGTIYSDCEPALTRVISDYQLTHGMKRYPAAENNLPPVVSKRSKNAAAKLGQVEFVLLEGHPSKKALERGIGRKNLPVSKFNVRADELCNRQKILYREGTNLTRVMNELRELGMTDDEVIDLIKSKSKAVAA